MLPAETHAWASDARSASGLTWLTATRSDESFFLRSAVSIESVISTTSLAAMRVQRGQPAAWAIASALPTMHELGRGMRVEEGAAGWQGDGRTVVASHAGRRRGGSVGRNRPPWA